MLRNLGFSSLSNFSRFLASGVLFIVLAALWPPELFGRFVFHHILALVAAMAADYGLPLKTLRDVGEAPTRARSLLLTSLAAQIWLVLPSAFIGFAFWLSGVVTDPLLFALLWLSHLLFNLVNTGYGALRGTGRFDLEARSALVANVLMFVLPLAAIWSGGDLRAVAAGMVGARLIQGVATAFDLARTSAPAVARTSSPPVFRTLLDARAYALEAWSSSLFQQADSFIVRFVLGEAALGLYQAGVRFVAVAVVLVQSLGNLVVPSLARETPDRIGFRWAFRRWSAAFAALGLVCFAGLGILGEVAVDKLYGEAYAPVAPLMPLFGLVALARCVAAGQGLALLALGHQTYRFYAVLVALAVFVPVGLLGSAFGLAGLIAANALVVTLLAALYWRRVRRDL